MKSKPQARPHHIGAFFCPRAGRIFDAGEFRDFAEVTVEDFFKRFKVDTRY